MPMADQPAERNRGAGCIVAGTVAFYFPLEWLVEQNETIESILESYVELWR
jgi:hypothetical protein